MLALAWFQTVLLIGFLACVLEVHSLGGSLPFGSDTPVCSERSTGGTAFSLV